MNFDNLSYQNAQEDDDESLNSLLALNLYDDTRSKPKFNPAQEKQNSLPESNPKRFKKIKKSDKVSNTVQKMFINDSSEEISVAHKEPNCELFCQMKESLVAKFDFQTLIEKFEFFKFLDPIHMDSHVAGVLANKCIIDALLQQPGNKSATFKLHKYLLECGYVVPPLESRRITMKYLIGVAHGWFFALKRGEFKPCASKLKMTKSEIIDQIKYCIGANLGFNHHTGPSKEFLQDMLYSIDSENEAFGGKRCYTFTPNLIQTPEGQMFEVPETFRGCIKLNKMYAAAIGEITNQKKRKELNYHIAMVSKGIIDAKRAHKMINKHVKFIPGAKFEKGFSEIRKNLGLDEDD